MKPKMIKVTAMQEPHKIEPTLSLDEEKLPEVKNWKVGKSYTVKVEMTMTGLHQDTIDKENEMRGDFKVNTVTAL